MSSFANEFTRIIDSYITKISDTYSIPANELKNLWCGDTKVVSKAPPVINDVLKMPVLPKSAELESLGKAELAAHCKTRGLKISGTKAELIQRLTGEAPTLSATPTTKAPAVKKVPVPEVEPKIKSLIQATQASYRITKNEFQNYWHAESGLVYDKPSMLFVGRQMPSGTIAPLNDEDIETCNRFKFKYTMPTTLASTGKKEADETELIDDEEELEPDDEEVEEETEIEEPLVDE